MMGRSASLLFGGALALFLNSSASGQDSSVEVASATYVPSSSKDVGSDHTFQMEGRPDVAAKKVSEVFLNVVQLLPGCISWTTVRIYSLVGHGTDRLVCVACTG